MNGYELSDTTNPKYSIDGKLAPKDLRRGTLVAAITGIAALTALAFDATPASAQRGGGPRDYNKPPAVTMPADEVKEPIAVPTESPSNAPLEFRRPPIGSSWTYTETRDIRGHERLVTENTYTYTGNMEHPITHELVARLDHAQATYNPHGVICHGATWTLHDLETWSWAGCGSDEEGFMHGTVPSSGWYKWPLDEGKKWRTEYHWIDTERGWKAYSQIDRKVTGFEEVTVPAGTYTTAKVEITKTNFGDDFGEVQWYAGETLAAVKIVGWSTPDSGYGGSKIEILLKDFNIPSDDHADRQK